MLYNVRRKKMKPRTKAKLARVGLGVATVACVSMALLSETYSIGTILPLVPILVALIPYFLYERCPHCRKTAFISKDW